MKPHPVRMGRPALPARTANGPFVRRTLRRRLASWLAILSLGAAASGLAAPAELGRLFYTPAQRAQLENARAHNVTEASGHTAPASPPPLRYDGVVIRSDGQTTRWVDGKPHVGASSVTDLKPGQIRAGGKVYEPYQVLRPAPASASESGAQEAAP